MSIVDLSYSPLYLEDILFEDELRTLLVIFDRIESILEYTRIPKENHPLYGLYKELLENL